MNILYRHLPDLAINLSDRQEQILYFQDHYYDNIYFTDPHGIFLGAVNLSGVTYNQWNHLFVDHRLSGTEALEWFQAHPGIYRVPLVMGNRLLGEYYDANSIGPSLYKMIEDKAQFIRPLFEDSIQEECERTGLVIDNTFAPHFRKMTESQETGRCSISEILIPILIRRVSAFFKGNGVSMVAIDGPRKKQFRELDKRDNVDRSLEEYLQDQALISLFCGDDLASYHFMQRHRYDLDRISRIVSNGVHNMLLDCQEPGFNIINGQRITTGIPEQATNQIHVFGPCVVQGLCVVDSRTVPSIIQSLVKEDGFMHIGVENHGLSYGKDLLNDLLYMMATPIGEGDVVVWFSGFSKKEVDSLSQNDIPVIDARHCTDHLKDWFLNSPFHCNAAANSVFASLIYKAIKELGLLRTVPNQEKTSFISKERVPLPFNPDAILDSTQLSNYLEGLTKIAFIEPDKSKGCVVIHANPCTKGHLYLIQEALKHVDLLYVFLVEESKDSFSYLDREYMLAENYLNNPRVRILSGGSVLTSELGFPEYFNRSNQMRPVDPLLNHKIFALKIAPVLGITYRFFGSEPEDEVTKVLNATAQEFLPQHGINVKIVERAAIDGKWISAKDVRRLFFFHKFDLLRDLVPESTYNRLVDLANQPVEILPFHLEPNRLSYPGRAKKFGTDLFGERYLVKVAESPKEILGFFSERIGGDLCKQLGIDTSDIRLFNYQDSPILMSRNWLDKEKEQYFPLVSYYEELLDTYEKNVDFSYDVFKTIAKKKCPKTYDTVISVFWRVMIIDYLLCNSRNATNLGFIDDGAVRLAPVYDNSTRLNGIEDNAWQDVRFPSLCMQFGVGNNSAYDVLTCYPDEHKDEAIKNAKMLMFPDTSHLGSPEERFLYQVILFRFNKLFN